MCSDHVGNYSIFLMVLEISLPYFGFVSSSFSFSYVVNSLGSDSALFRLRFWVSFNHALFSMPFSIIILITQFYFSRLLCCFLILIHFSFTELLWKLYTFLHRVVVWHCFHLCLSYSSVQCTFQPWWSCLIPCNLMHFLHILLQKVSNTFKLSNLLWCMRE